MLVMCSSLAIEEVCFVNPRSEVAEVNFLFKSTLSLLAEPYFSLVRYIGSLCLLNWESPGIRWNMLLSDAEASVRDPPKGTEIETRQDASCRIGDFNIKDLQTLGHLQIQWTSYWDEHHERETKPDATVLRLCWYQPALAQFLVQKQVVPHVLIDMNHY